MKLPKKDANIESDYKLARTNLLNILKQCEHALTEAIALATNSEDPKALMVVSDLLKKSAEINQQLLELSMQKLDLLEKSKSKPAPTGGNIYVDKQINITTAQLNKMLSEKGD